MAQANLWQDQYAISRTAAIGTAATFGASSGEIGMDTNKFGVFLNGHPDIVPGQAFINQRKSSGLSTRLARRGAGGTINVESRPGLRSPITTWEMHATPKILGLVMWLLFQSNVTEGASTPFTKVYLPPTSTSTTTFETFCSILRKTGDPQESQAVHGCVVPHVMLSATQGEALMLTIDFTGVTYAQNFDASAITLDFAEEAPLLWQDCTLLLSGSTINANGFTLDLTANLVPKHHDSQTIVKFVMGEFGGTGTLDFPLANATVGDQVQRANFIAGTPVPLSLEWGSAGNTGHFKLDMNVQHNDVPYGGDDELMSNISFDLVHDEPQTIDQAIQVTISDGVDRGI